MTTRAVGQELLGNLVANLPKVLLHRVLLDALLGQLLQQLEKQLYVGDHNCPINDKDLDYFSLFHTLL